MAEEYIQFMSRIKKKLDIDLSLYKEAQMKRRLTSLRDKRGFANFDLYFKALDSNHDLLNEFLDKMTINVSSFFRNSNRWDVLQQKILPGLIDEKKTLKIWSAACSTGEEPYSMAIMLQEHFPEVNARILATDIDENMLKRARHGAYLKSALTELPDPLKNKYFTKENDIYRVKDDLKSSITFKKHNLLQSPYPKNIDLIICRNVLIYFTDKAKESIYHNFSQSMNRNGVLFVGSTEQIFSPDQYDLELMTTFFYRRKAADA